ncbi:MAG TPA: TonB-dependent receptor [Vicinamibacterales bacterium]|nr:TonB-dependent receptor [Vicinamibacterales bacterium]
MQSSKRACPVAWVLVLFVLFGAASAYGQVGGSISGTIKDASGGVIPGVTITATNLALGTPFTAPSDRNGFYSLPKLPVGRYDLLIQIEGFKPQKRTNIGVDAGAALQINATLEVGGPNETVTISANEIRVDTVSTQLGEVVSARTMTTLALNGRSYTDLLAIQPGVIPITTIQPNSVIMAGVTGTIAPSGQLNAGNVSVSGQRETANGFFVNGADVQEHMNGGTSVVPNLDSIDEFRVLTNNFDPQYGNYNGGIVNVITKSGTNTAHGDAFEFFRNTSLDARNFFSPARAAFNQNQPGATIGAPLRKDRLFFFGDYEATRTTQGIETGLIPVPSMAERAGNFAGAANSLTGTVNGQYWANLLSEKLGYGVTPGERYYTPGCATSSQCVFPNAILPAAVWSAPAQRLLQYIPSPNSGTSQFSTGAYPQTVRDDKFATRADASTRFGLMSGYYFFDDYRLDNPYPGQQGGASVPGFDALTVGRVQLASFSTNTVLGTSGANEFHASVMRNANNVGLPNGGRGVSVASQGFVTGPGTPGIVVQAPRLEGVENIAFETFTMGVTITGVNQVNTTLNFSDSVSKVFGSHTARMGGQFQFGQVELDPNATFNGTFTFAGTETGSDFADFLLGIPSNYIQSAGGIFHLRNKYGALFAQDSWRVNPKVTLNYGLRWDVMQPWYERDNQIQTIVPGEQSVVFPGAPVGLVVPGDPGVARGLTPTRWGSLSPRIGVAIAPSERTSLRASYGLFYTAFQGLSAGIMYGVPPYGYNYLSPAPPLFATPFITAADGTDNGQRFPGPAPPLGASPRHAVTNFNWSNFLPVNADPFFANDNHVPHSENYMFSVQQELAANTVLTASYVGSRGRDLLVIRQANPGNPALCLSVSQPSQVAAGSPTCGPFAENGVFTTAAGQVLNSTRGVLGPNYGSVTRQETTGYSRYSGLELNLHFTRQNGTILAGYTLSKSVDVASNLGEQVNPFNVRLSEAPSAFDMRHNFVISYNYNLPINRFFQRPTVLTEGWTISGTAHFSSGFPVTLYNDTDSSLLGTFGNGVNNHLADTPNYAPGCDLEINHNPGNGPAFDTSCFSIPPLGQMGNAPRRFFYGPGMENFDMSLVKNVPFGGSRSLQIRLEAFNVFNHPQFVGAGAVDGNVASPTFGQIIGAAAPRLVQIAAKFAF